MQFLTALLFATMAVAEGTAPLYFTNYFGDSPGLLEVGKSYTAEWTAKEDYNVSLVLVQKSGSGWEPVKNIFAQREYKTGNFSQEFTVPNVQDDQWFALWLDGSHTDPQNTDSKTGYADITHWFGINGGTLVAGSGLTKAGIAGIVVGVLAAVSLVAAAAWFLIARRRRAARKPTVVLPVAEPSMEERRSMDTIDEIKERAELAAKGT